MSRNPKFNESILSSINTTEDFSRLNIGPSDIKAFKSNLMEFANNRNTYKYIRLNVGLYEIDLFFSQFIKSVHNSVLHS